MEPFHSKRASDIALLDTESCSVVTVERFHCGSGIDFLDCAYLFYLAVAKVVLQRTDIYPCQTCPSAFLSQDDLIQHAAKHNHFYLNKHVLKAETGSKNSSTCTYGCFAKPTSPVNKQNRRVKETNPQISIGEHKNHEEVNKDYKDDKKKITKSEKIIQSEYIFIKNEPQSNLENSNSKNKKISKPPAGNTQLNILKPDPWKKEQSEQTASFRTEIVQNSDKTQITENCDGQYSCGQCPQSFRTLTEIKIHLESHINSSFTCKKCLESFISLRQLNKHSINTHFTKCDIKCDICHKTLKTHRNLRLHLLTHTGEKPFSCQRCGKRFTQNGSLQMHMKIHLGLKEHACGYCSKAFTEYKNMRNHERTHTKERPFECRFCGKRFGDSSALIRHIRTHTGNKMYHCSQCPMKFSDPSGLAAHTKRHNGIKSYACAFCDKRFTTQHILSNHESSVHMKLKNFVCEICTKNFTLKQYLKNHILRMHMLGDHTSCGVCKMKFYSNAHFEKHISKGCVKDKYTCDYCGDQFSLKMYLKRHMEKTHLEPLYCHICLKGYYSDYDLQKHKSRCVLNRKIP